MFALGHVECVEEVLKARRIQSGTGTRTATSVVPGSQATSAVGGTFGTRQLFPAGSKNQQGAVECSR